MALPSLVQPDTDTLTVKRPRYAASAPIAASQKMIISPSRASTAQVLYRFRAAGSLSEMSWYAHTTQVKTTYDNNNSVSSWVFSLNSVTDSITCSTWAI